MSQSIAKTDSKTVNWSPNLRIKVGQSVNYNGYVWSNLTGINGEPGVTTDWIAISVEISSEVRPTIVINGNLFTLSKSPLNNDPTKKSDLEANDDILNGSWDETEFWQLARYLGGVDPNVKGNWNIIASIEEIPTI